MRILIYGAGAMGLYFAARLLEAEHQVVLQSRDGFALDPVVSVAKDDPESSSHGVANQFTPGWAEGDFDLAIVATKSWQVDLAAERLEGVLSPGVPILTYQNGIDAPGVVRARLPRNPVIASTCVVIVKKLNPHTVQLIGDEATLNCGLFDSTEAEVELDLLIREIFANTPILATVVNDVRASLWKKLALISSYGGIGAVSDLPVGKTRSHQATRSLVREGIRECALVARSLGVGFSEADEEEVFAIYTDVFEDDTTSSMQRDLRAGVPSELDSQSGAIVRNAKALGVSVPVHAFIYQTQSARERCARKGF